MKSILLLLVSAVFSGSAVAAGYVPKIQAFINCEATNHEAKIRMLMGARDAAKTLLESVPKCLDDTIAPALDEAGNAADLRTAIKELYVKAKAYNEKLRFGSEFEERAASSAASEAFDKFNLEAKLAHKTL
jgi:hypothetical protein